MLQYIGEHKRVITCLFNKSLWMIFYLLFLVVVTGGYNGPIRLKGVVWAVAPAAAAMIGIAAGKTLLV